MLYNYNVISYIERRVKNERNTQKDAQIYQAVCKT